LFQYVIRTPERELSDVRCVIAQVRCHLSHHGPFGRIAVATASSYADQRFIAIAYSIDRMQYIFQRIRVCA
jgi:hypothetical protein